MCSPPAILTPAPVDVEGPLVPAIQATWFSKSQLLFVDLAVPLEAHVEEVPSQYEDEMYERLMGQTAQPATRSKVSKSRSTSETTRSTWGGQKASLCWWWLYCWLCHLNRFRSTWWDRFGSGSGRHTGGGGGGRSSCRCRCRCNGGWGYWGYCSCSCSKLSSWNTSDMGQWLLGINQLLKRKGHVESSSFILTDRSTEIKRHSIVPVRLICLTLFYFKKHKQDQPLKFIKDK